MKRHDRSEPARSLFEAHPRSFEANRYVYPVLSRRAGGISIGVNLSPDKACNFDCVYCQVDRTEPGRTERGKRKSIDTKRLFNELDAMLDLVMSGRIYEQTKFRDTPEPLRRLNDVALSGDGEPTLCREFEFAVAVCTGLRRRYRLDDLKLVVITNASRLHVASASRALAMLDVNNGEVWAKLDAGTEAYYRKVNRSAVAWLRILDNLRKAAGLRPIVIQSLFMRVDDQPPSPSEQDAYCDRLCEILAAGGRIKLVQIHTVARPPAEPRVTALGKAELDALAGHVRDRTGLPVATYHA